MRVQLRNEPSFRSAETQVLYNRGIKDIDAYLDAGMQDVSPPEALGEELLKQGVEMLLTHIAASDPVLVVVDADCDGYTSAALLINYLYDLFPYFVTENIEWYIHEGKQHGLSDCIEYAKEFELVILPDSGR